MKHTKRTKNPEQVFSQKQTTNTEVGHFISFQTKQKNNKQQR